MNYLAGKKVYLSSPMQKENDATVLWRKVVGDTLVSELNVNLFDPSKDIKQQKDPELKAAVAAEDWDNVAKIVKDFVHKDLTEVDTSNVIVAVLPKGVPTTGCVHEIINAVNMKKPVIIFCPQGKANAPLWYFGFIPHEMIFGDIHSMMDYLHEVNDGKHKHNRKWHYIYGVV